MFGGKFAIRLLTVAGLAMWCGTATAAETSANSQEWYTGAHFGGAFEDSSTTGFSRSSGAAMFFDVSRKMGGALALGFRSFGSGAELPRGKFYRLMSGPLVTWDVWRSWSLQFFPAYFQEAAESASNESCQSTGGAMFIGWERRWQVSQKVDISTGAFISRHWGEVRSYNRPATDASASLMFSEIRRNEGQSRGFEIALRTVL